MSLIALAAGEVNKKSPGYDVTEGWGMIAAAGLTVVGMLIAAWVAYSAGRRQVADQGLIEHRHWRRQNRLEAYKQFMVATDGFTEAMDKWRTARSTTDIGRALEALSAAAAGIRLSGPQALQPHADKVTQAAGTVYRRLRHPVQVVLPIPTQLWLQLSRGVINAQNTFVVEAAKVLDDPNL
ncbi:hypothetical protein [Streptomyces sp. NPDC005780]|uniref:hypothetical protein n=1 Tax=Streptomyces sp. NPDC005780 TaxID=3364730 RepID=UPI0036889B7C